MRQIEGTGPTNAVIDDRGWKEDNPVPERSGEVAHIMNETGSEEKNRPEAKFGTVSILCFLVGTGLFLSLWVSFEIGRPPDSSFFAWMGLLAWLVALVLAVIGLSRRERPLWPAALGCLLVSGIIVLGVVLVFFAPPLTAARLKARRENCLSNEKQILLAIAMYADDNGGRCPMDSANPTLIGSMKLLSNLLTSAKVFYCPDDPRPGSRPATNYESLTTLNISYSYVPNLKWHDTPVSPVILDRIYSTAKGDPWPTNLNHRGQGGNVGFNDGNVRWCKVLPTALKDKDGKQVVLSP